MLIFRGQFSLSRILFFLDLQKFSFIEVNVDSYPVVCSSLMRSSIWRWWPDIWGSERPTAAGTGEVAVDLGGRSPSNRDEIEVADVLRNIFLEIARKTVLKMWDWPVSAWMGRLSVGRLYRPWDFEVGYNNIVSNCGFSDVDKDTRTYWIIVSKRSALVFSNVVGWKGGRRN